MEDDLKILKVEYLSNHWSDLLQISNLSYGDQTQIKFGLNFEIKMTSDGRWLQNIKSGISQQHLIGSSSNCKSLGENQIWNEDDLWGRLQIIKSGISQQPLIGSSSYFKPILRGPNQNDIWIEIWNEDDLR
jgi:hypothetical protein